MLSLIKETNAVIAFPDFQGDQLYMHEFDLGAIQLPKAFERWLGLLKHICSFSPVRAGKAWLTIDQKEVEIGHTHRRGGPHVDGNYVHSWGGGGGGWLTGEDGRVLPPDLHNRAYCAPHGGMLIASDVAACRGWTGEYTGIPRQGGDCSHMLEELTKLKSLIMEPLKLYWTNSTAIHESLPFKQPARRSLIRITLPETAPSL